MARNYFKKGSFNRIGDDDGFKHKAEDTKERWDGLIVSERGWEPRNEQEFVRGIPDYQAVIEARPEGTDTFQSANIPLGLFYLLRQSGGMIDQQGGGSIFLQSQSILDTN